MLDMKLCCERGNDKDFVHIKVSPCIFIDEFFEINVLQLRESVYLSM